MNLLFYLRCISLFILFMWGCYGMLIAQTSQNADDSLLHSSLHKLDMQKMTDSEQTAILFEVGLLYSKNDIYDSALFYLTKALDMPGGKGFHGGRIIVNIANTYVYQGRYIEALKYYLEALSVSEKADGIDSQFNIIRARANISEAYYMVGNHSQALYYAESAYKKYVAVNSVGAEYILPQIFYVIGAVHLSREELEKAEEYMLKAYETAEIIYQDSQNTGGILIYKSYGMEGLAKIYLTKKNYEKALEDFAAQFPNVRFHFFGEEKRIEERIEFIVYCCANELVNNSIHHSGAKNINLQLIQEGKYVSLTIQDDGCGFDEKSIVQGLGLRNIRDRVTSCNGRIDIASSPDKGTETIIELKTRNKGI